MTMRLSDADMYQGPIRLIYSETQRQVENLVLTAVQKVGVAVDKNELLRALAYDRGQYEKGRADALATIVRCKDCKHYDGESCCEKIGLTVPNNGAWFCAEGERRDDNENA